MGNKKTKRRAGPASVPQHGRPGAGAEVGEGAPRDEARRQKREEARQQAQARLRKLQRRRLLKRGAVWGAAVALVVAGVAYYVVKQQAKNRVVSEAQQVAQAAGCTPVTGEPDLGNPHLSPGEQHAYTQRPATSGPHDPGPLPGSVHVYSSPVQETNAVHNLEHGYVLIYYRMQGSEALPASVVTSLENLAGSENKVIVAPYTQLGAGKALALAAWDELQQCPSTVTGQQATSLAQAFIARFRGGGRAPEPGAP